MTFLKVLLWKDSALLIIRAYFVYRKRAVNLITWFYPIFSIVWRIWWVISCCFDHELSNLRALQKGSCFKAPPEKTTLIDQHWWINEKFCWHSCLLKLLEVTDCFKSWRETFLQKRLSRLVGTTYMKATNLFEIRIALPILCQRCNIVRVLVTHPSLDPPSVH